MEEVKVRDIGLINGGTSSFSPSPMKVQYEILERRYKIKPDFVVVSSIAQHNKNNNNNNNNSQT